MKGIIGLVLVAEGRLRRGNECALEVVNALGRLRTAVQPWTPAVRLMRAPSSHSPRLCHFYQSHI
jgi:hypothetical protein